MQSLTEKRDAGKRKRRRNRSFSAHMLEKAGIPFVSKNNGAHLIVAYGDLSFDFFPGTGLFISRTGPSEICGRGIYHLLECLGVNR